MHHRHIVRAMQLYAPLYVQLERCLLSSWLVVSELAVVLHACHFCRSMYAWCACCAHVFCAVSYMVVVGTHTYALLV